MNEPSLLIAYHSQSGASAALARAAAAGARAHLSDVSLRRCIDVSAPEVAAAGALLLVCAENSGRLAGGAKDFLDRMFYPLITRRCTLPYALLISAGNDGRGAAEEAARIFRGIPFTQAVEPTIIRGRPEAGDLAMASELGEGLATGVSMGIF